VSTYEHTQNVSTYEHTQKAPLHWLLYPPGVVLVAAAWLSRGQILLALVMLGAATLLLTLGFSFQRLTIRDEGAWLAIRYGPLRVFRARIAYADISAVAAGQTSWIDGWGIHWIPGRGYTYNLWGFSCATLCVRGRTVRVGSDDAAQLVEFLKSKLPAARSTSG
jgi:hypothetical protein